MLLCFRWVDPLVLSIQPLKAVRELLAAEPRPQGLLDLRETMKRRQTGLIWTGSWSEDAKRLKPTLAMHSPTGR